MKRILVKIEKLNEDTMDAIQTAKNKEASKMIPHNKAYPMREKPELSNKNSSEIGLPSIE